MRFLKQFLYGVFYLAIIGLIGWGIYAHSFKPAPSCHDGVQDQGEQGIDCGGPCGNVCTAGLLPITANGAWVFSNGTGAMTLLARVANPNPNAAAQSFSYSFIVSDSASAIIARISGALSLYPGQVGYIVSPNEAVSGTPATVALVIPTSTIAWVSTSTMGSAPVFTFQDLSFSSPASGTVQAAGTLTSPASFTGGNVVVDAIFKDANGNPVGASQTELNHVSANGSVPFSISYPIDPATVDLSQTEVEAYAMN